MTSASDKEQAKSALKERVQEEGLSAEEAVQAAKQLGLSITEAILLVRESFDLTLGEAKSCVTRNEAWEADAQASDYLHEELLSESGGEDE